MLEAAGIEVKEMNLLYNNAEGSTFRVESCCRPSVSLSLCKGLTTARKQMGCRSEVTFPFRHGEEKSE